MAQVKVQTTNTNNVWDEKKTYKVNSVVAYNGFLYQNLTGKNSVPSTLIDWIEIKSIGSDSYLLKDPTTYNVATLPLGGTEVAVLNNGTNWVKITWNNIKSQLKAYFDNIYAPIGSGGNVDTSPKRSYFAEWKLGGGMSASTSWYQQDAFSGLRGGFSANASLTPSNSFANCSVQTPAFVLPFQAKIKAVTVRGFTNGTTGATIRTCVVKSDNGDFFLNPAIIGDVSYLLNSPSINSFHNQFTSTGLTFTTLPALTQIRIFNFNNNQNTPLQDTIISVEFEEVI